MDTRGERKERLPKNNLAKNGAGRKLAGAHRVWRGMPLQTDNNGSIMFEPCVPHGTDRNEVKVSLSYCL